METLGGRLRALRIARGMTQAAVGQAAHVSDSQLCAVENGGAPSPELLSRLADFYGVPVPDLLQGVSTPRPARAGGAALTAIRRNHSGKHGGGKHNAGDHRSGMVHGDYVDPMRAAAWNDGLDRLPVSPEMRVHALAVILLFAWAHNQPPLPVLEMLADRRLAASRSLERVAHDQARKGR